MNGLTIPEQCGTILLPETVVFPHGALPLHIFEERYREMLDDALESHCMICVSTLKGVEVADPAQCTEPIGTIGLIRTSRELTDGRSNLVLHGVHRVRFLSWKTEKPYPLAEIKPISTESLAEEEAPLLISELRDKVHFLLADFPPEMKEQVNSVLDRASVSPAILADAISQQFVQDHQVRLELLTETCVQARYHLLMKHLDTLQPR